MQWSQILAEIKRSLKEPDTDGHWADSELLRRANLIQKEICRQTKCMVKTAQLAVNNDVFNLPADCLKILDVSYNNTRLYGTTIDQLDADFELCRHNFSWRQQTGQAEKYYKDFNVIRLYPQDSNATNITVRYIGDADDLQDSTDEPFNGASFLQNSCQAIIDGVCFRCLLEDGDQRYVAYKQLYDIGIEQIKQQLMVEDKVEFFNLGRKI